MPDIKEYTSPIDGLAPQSRGSEADAQEGRRVGVFYHQIGQEVSGAIDTYEQHQSDEEKLNLLHSSTALENNALTDWQSYANDPANKGRTDLAATYMQQVQGKLQDWSSHAQTREGKMLAGELQDRIEQHMFERTAADQSTMSGTWAVEKANDIGNGIVSRIGADPSSADLSIQTIKDTGEALFPTTGIDPASRARAVAEWTDTHVRAAATAYYQSSLNSITEQYATGATSSPAETQVLKDATNGKYGDYVGDELSKIPGLVDEARARGQERFRVANDAQQKSDEIAYKAQATQLATAVSDAIASGQPITAAMLQARDKLVNDPKAAGLIGGDIDRVNGLIRDGIKAQADHTYTVTDPHTSADIIGRLSLPAGDPRAVTEDELVRDVANKTLSHDDYAMYHEALPKIAGDPAFKSAQQTVNQWIEGYKSQITGKGSLPGGATAFAQFKHDAMLQFMGWGKSEGDWGKAADILTNAQNPRSFNRMVGEYTRAARTNDPLGTLNKIPGYGHLSGVADGSAMSPILGPTPGGSHTYGNLDGGGDAAPPPGPLNAKDSADMARIAGGH